MATVVAYGVHADLAQFESGLFIIMLVRRLMWPMIGGLLLSAIALFFVVISGRRRIWWLVGLAPTLAMLVHRFSPGAVGPAAIDESPSFVSSSNIAAPEAGDYVVGVVFEGKPYALPYRVLFTKPVLVLTDYDKRALVIWNAYANCATVVNLTRELRPRDLEVVSSPANSLLLFDRRLGQFISGVTGRLVDRKRVDSGPAVGFGPRINSEKMPWSTWLFRHPQTVTLASPRTTNIPNRPILPVYPIGLSNIQDASMSIAMFPTTRPTPQLIARPAAVATDIAANGPVNLSMGDRRVLLFNDRDHRLVAFDRDLKGDSFLTINPLSRPNRKFPDAVLIDAETHSLWTINGRAIDGALKGTQLKSVAIETGLYWGVMKYWYPDMQLLK